MTIRSIHPAVFFATIILCLSVGPGSVHAQSEAELRRVNEQLRTQVRDLEKELEVARARIQELEREVDALRRALAASPGPLAPPVEDAPPIDLSNPTSSPPALLHTLIESYEEALADMEYGQPETRERSVYLRTVARWTASVNRRYRNAIEWHIRIDRAEATRQGYDMRVVAVDPKSSKDIGDPFDIAVPRSMARRYDQLRERGEAVSILMLRGVLIPEIEINENRPERGSFDNPRFIGPFAEFGFSVEPRSLLPVGEDEERR